MAEIVEAPKGYSGHGFFLTSLESAVGLARKNSIWPLPFATSCCGIEFMATAGAHYDLGRFGSERLSFSPRQADLLMVMGTIAKKMAPVLKQVYEQMTEPKWVMAVGACASSGGIFDTYSVVQGIDEADAGNGLFADVAGHDGVDHAHRHVEQLFGGHREAQGKDFPPTFVAEPPGRDGHDPTIAQKDGA